MIERVPYRAFGDVVVGGPARDFIDGAQTTFAPATRFVHPAHVDARRRHGCNRVLLVHGARRRHSASRSATSATGAPVRATSSCGERLKTACGWPAAAQRVSSVSRSASISVTGGGGGPAR